MGERGGRERGTGEGAADPMGYIISGNNIIIFPCVILLVAQNMGWTSGSTSNLIGWSGSNGNAGGNQHGWVDEKGSSQKGTVGQVVDAVAEAAKAEGRYLIYHIK